MNSTGTESEMCRRIGELVIEETMFNGLLDEFKKIVASAVSSAFAKRDSLSKEASNAPVRGSQAESDTRVGSVEKQSAATLRTALLLGKIPDDAGMLIDAKTTASLLNISCRTLYRLCHEEAVPAPVRLGGIVRWRVLEITEWIDNDCPTRRNWTYSGRRPSSKRK